MDPGLRRDGGWVNVGKRRMIHPVILSGGSGTRLWPMSRSLYPKQLLALVGERSLLQQTVLRVAGAFAVSRFVEKPDAATAERYLASGEYFWNSGIFLFPAALYLAEIERLRPDMLAACKAALAGERAETDFIRLDKAAFTACPS